MLDQSARPKGRIVPDASSAEDDLEDCSDLGSVRKEVVRALGGRLRLTSSFYSLSK